MMSGLNSASTARTVVTENMFGANVVLTKDSIGPSSPWTGMLNQISFTNFRYPGGSVTEQHTWKNGGLQKIFGSPIATEADERVLTLREALEFSVEKNAGMTIVIPTFQFYETSTGRFDHSGFSRYLAELKKALSEHPQAKIKGFEIGNEFWAELTPAQYGAVANAELPKLHALREDLQRTLGKHWDVPTIGIQAGSQWKATSDLESKEIAAGISVDNRGLVDVIYQHHYPDVSKDTDGQLTRAMKAMKEYARTEGFKDSLNFSMSEFNTGKNTAAGVNQAAKWIEEFHKHIDAGIDEIVHWGLTYANQSNKFYDTKFPDAEADGGNIMAIATPVGQVYDIARTHLVGKHTITDAQAIRGMGVPQAFGVTGFEGVGQRIVFLNNDTGGPGIVNLGSFSEGQHIAVHHLVPADSPLTGHDESISTPPADLKAIIDARGDMMVRSGKATSGEVTLGSNELIAVIITDPGQDLVLEGSHHVTDPSTGMGNDYIIGGSGRDILRGHAGDDTLDGGAGRDVAIGGRGDDLILGGAGSDILIADRGRDTLNGGNGDDIILVSGLREDDHTTIILDEGVDTVLTGGHQNATIRDFSKEDKIGFNGIFAGPDALGAATTVRGDDLVVNMPGGEEVILSGAARLTGGLSGRVVDFLGTEATGALISSAFSDLIIAQIMEVAPLLQSVGTKNDGSSPWPDAREAMSRYDKAGDVGGGGGGAAGEGSGGNPAGNPESHPWQPDENHRPDDGTDKPAERDPGSGGGGCFVATAAYGDPDHPDVVALRAFRDLHLVRSAAGRGFIAFYGVAGPWLAGMTRPHQIHARAFRAVLSRIVQGLCKIGLIVI